MSKRVILIGCCIGVVLFFAILYQEPRILESDSYPKFVRRASPKELTPSDTFLCMKGEAGRLNNQIIEVYRLITVAIHTKRTLVVPPLVSQVYDINSFQNMCSECSWKIAIPYNDRLCRWHAMLIDWNLTAHALKKGTFHSKTPVIAIDSATIYFNDLYPNHCEPFFTYVRPKEKILKYVNQFIKEKLGHTFVAVHLRWLEGHCSFRAHSPELCPSNYTTTKAIARAFGVDNLKIYVASDGQRPDVERTYPRDQSVFLKDAPFSLHGLTNLQKAVLEFEIATRSVLFVGDEASTVAISIRNFQLLRYSQHGRNPMSVLRWNLLKPVQENRKLAEFLIQNRSLYCHMIP